MRPVGSIAVVGPSPSARWAAAGIGERSMDARWRIELFGGLRAVREERVVTHFPTQKAASLLAYLALTAGRRQQPHSREELTELLWPEHDTEAARNSLRVALHALRRQL